MPEAVPARAAVQSRSCCGAPGCLVLQLDHSNWHPHSTNCPALGEPGWGSGKVSSQILKQRCRLLWEGCAGSEGGTATEGASQKLEIGHNASVVLWQGSGLIMYRLFLGSHRVLHFSASAVFTALGFSVALTGEGGCDGMT